MTLSKKRKTERRLEHGRTDEPEENRDREQDSWFPNL